MVSSNKGTNVPVKEEIMENTRPRNPGSPTTPGSPAVPKGGASPGRTDYFALCHGLSARHLIDEEGVTTIYMERARGQCR